MQHSRFLSVKNPSDSHCYTSVILDTGFKRVRMQALFSNALYSSSRESWKCQQVQALELDEFSLLNS